MNIGLPHVFDLAVHLVNFFGWVSQGDHSETLLPEHSFMLKSYRWVGWVVAHKTLLSAPVPIGIGIWGLGLGLDNLKFDILKQLVLAIIIKPSI